MPVTSAKRKRKFNLWPKTTWNRIINLLHNCSNATSYRRTVNDTCKDLVKVQSSMLYTSTLSCSVRHEAVHEVTTNELKMQWKYRPYWMIISYGNMYISYVTGSSLQVTCSVKVLPGVSSHREGTVCIQTDAPPWLCLHSNSCISFIYKQYMNQLM